MYNHAISEQSPAYSEALIKGTGLGGSTQSDIFCHQRDEYCHFPVALSSIQRLSRECYRKIVKHIHVSTGLERCCGGTVGYEGSIPPGILKKRESMAFICPLRSTMERQPLKATLLCATLEPFRCTSRTVRCLFKPSSQSPDG